MGAKSKDPENACSVNTASRRSHKAGSRELPGAAWRMTQPESYDTARQAAIKAFTAKDAKSAKENPINMDRSRPRLRLLRLPSKIVVVIVLVRGHTLLLPSASPCLRGENSAVSLVPAKISR